MARFQSWVVMGRRERRLVWLGLVAVGVLGLESATC